MNHINKQMPTTHKMSEQMFLFRRAYYYTMRHTIILPLLVLILSEPSLFAQNKYDFSQFGH